MTVSTSNQANVTTTRNQSGQFAPSNEQRAKAEKLALERNSRQRYLDCQALFDEHLDDAESDIAEAISAGDYYMSVAQCNDYYKKLRAPARVDPIHEGRMPFIRTQQDADVYFRDAALNFTRAFKVVVETPTQTQAKTDFFIRVYFPRQHQIVKVMFLRVIPFLDDLQKAVLVAFMHRNYTLATKEPFEIN